MTTVDRDEVVSRLSTIADVVKGSEIGEDAKNQIDAEIGDISALLHAVDKPVYIEERGDGSFEIIVSS